MQPHIVSEKMFNSFCIPTFVYVYVCTCACTCKPMCMSFHVHVACANIVEHVMRVNSILLAFRFSG